MARLLRETTWRGWTDGDVFRIPGVRGRRFRFRAHVTNFENGSTYIEANEVGAGSFRSFDTGTKIVRERRRRQEDDSTRNRSRTSSSGG